MLLPVVATESQNRDEFKTLEEGLNSGMMDVTEPGGTHYGVRINNNYDTEAVIIDGEGISGGRQNRIAASSLVIEPNQSNEIPVFCSEKGRWRGSSQFDTSQTIAYPTIRRLNTRSKTSKRETNPQNSIWTEIRKRQTSMHVQSQTQSMQSIYKQKETELSHFHVEYTPEEDQVGFVAATQNRILCVDIFYNNALFGKYYVRLLISYGLDAMEDQHKGQGKFDDKKVSDFYDGLFTSNEIPKKKNAQENPYKFSTGQNAGIGKILFYKDKMVHASFFPE